MLDAYFGPNGIEYSVGRIPMGSCDFSVESYSFDDVPGDYNLTHFDDGVERDTAQRVSVRGKGLAAVSVRTYICRGFVVSWFKAGRGAAAGETPRRLDREWCAGVGARGGGGCTVEVCRTGTP